MSAVPDTMRAAVIHEFGGIDKLSVETVPTPRPNAHEVLIQLDAAGVGSWDAQKRQGEWDEDAEFPVILGLDGAGTVAAVGSRVTRLSVGDRVYAYSYDNPKGGFHAEYVAVPQNRVGATPAGLDPLQAGGAPAIALTALQGVDDTLEVAEGERLIIHGASGNVGMLALQFAKWRGARVLAIASGADGVQLVIQLGADVAIDGKVDDIDAALDAFAPDGADAVLALVGGKELTRCLDALRPGGRVAYPNGIPHEPRKRRGIGITSYDAESGVREFERLNAAFEGSHATVPIAASYPLADVALAHQRVAGHVTGKVVLTMK